MRLFLAANFDAERRQELYAAAASLREAAPTLAWVACDLLHVTLKFLGDQNDGLVATLVPRLRTVGGSFTACDTLLGGFGAFPNFRVPRVVWMGAVSGTPLAAVAAAIDDACASVGVAREERPFHVHVTLGRVKRGLRADEARRLECAAVRWEGRVAWRVQTVDLMRSDLGHSGPKYSVLESITLGATQ